MSILKRASNFVERSRWLNNFMPSYCATLLALVNLKTTPSKEMFAAYKDMPFSFTAKDMSAIREVLADEEYKFLKQDLLEISDPVILDIGANIGTFALWSFGVNSKADILSVEASKATYERLNKNIALAKQEKDISWTATHRAAWHNDETISFHDSHESMAGKVSQEGTQSVQGISLSDLIEIHLTNSQKEFIDILKIDIEGSEEKFLEQSQKNFSALNKVKRLVIELHPSYCDISGVEKLIKSKFSKIENCTDRLSSKPLWNCTK